MSPEPCHDPVSTPVRSTDSPLVSKCVRRFSFLSPITPQNNVDKICNRGRDRPKAKLVGRFTRSMAKGNSVKTPVTDNVQVETVVLDDEETNLNLPVNDNIVHPEFVSNPVDESTPVIGKDIPAFDKGIREDSVIDSPAK